MTDFPATTKIRNALGVVCGLTCLVTLAALVLFGGRNDQRFLAPEYRTPRSELGKDLRADIKGVDIYVDQAELDGIHLERRILPAVFVVSLAGALALSRRKRPSGSGAAD